MIKIASISRGLCGPGPLAGYPTVFVRTRALQDIDLGHSDGWEILSEEQVLAKAEALAGGPCLITLTGDDAAFQPLEELIALGHENGWRFHLNLAPEGMIDPLWLDDLDYLTVNIAPPSATTTVNFGALHRVIGAGLAGKPALAIQVAVCDEADFAFALMIHELFLPVDLFVCAARETFGGTASYDLYANLTRTQWLAEKVLESNEPDIRISVDVPAYLWGDRGYGKYH